MTIVIFLVVLTVLVLVHELGHYLVAKFFKIKVEEFGIGFPPKVWGKKIGETLYSINALPIGGFVKLFGEDEAGAGRLKIPSKKIKVSDSSRAYYARPPWQKALVVASGVIMNFVLAVVIISFLFAFVGVGIAGDKVIVSSVLKDSPAQTAGLKSGDIIEEVNGQKITSTQQLINETKKYLGKEISLSIRSGKDQKELKITPRKEYPKNQGPIGVAITQNFEVKKYPWYEAPIVGTKEALKTSWLIIVSFGQVISQLVTQGIVPKEVAGPIGIAQLTGQVVQVGPFAVLSFVAILSLNLAILNILPIPALDGGRLFFVLIEAVTRRRVHPKFESYAHAVGMAFLLALILLITLHDITRVISGQSIIPK